ncbi:hypothetical protein HGH92_26985 [Chitinophaga varians]|uniref:Uncharacterized protein n=1 Tax=Chitinophaga varians TaxID=2202339 RepID=A0A847RQM0_9BACT|nr:hypothetical protein [Chitinophaga varians]NLR67980.1 hypothetical protein [Chitinophaga varians]
MEQQQTIFDKSFDEVHTLRRRQLMQPWLKLYTWITIGFGLLFSFLIFRESITAFKASPQDNAGYIVGFAIVGIIISAIYLAPAVLVWLEVKWAIWFNIVIAALWVVTIALGTIMSGTDSLYVGVTIIYFIPFWAGLFPLRRRWSKEAISGPTLRKLRGQL